MKALSRLLIAAIGAAAFASCTQNGSLIYLNIQKVTKTNTSSSIPLDITVSEIVGIGAGGTAPYYVAAGKIYNGTVPSPGSTNWNAIGVPQANGKDMLCNALAWDGINLWGGFFSSDGSTFGLYSNDSQRGHMDSGNFGTNGWKADYVSECHREHPVCRCRHRFQWHFYL